MKASLRVRSCFVRALKAAIEVLEAGARALPMWNVGATGGLPRDGGIGCCACEPTETTRSQERRSTRFVSSLVLASCRQIFYISLLSIDVVLFLKVKMREHMVVRQCRAYTCVGGCEANDKRRCIGTTRNPTAHGKKNV